MAKPERFSLPHGRLLLAEYAGQVVGMGCLQMIESGVGEVTRMYVPPAFRRRGMGRALPDTLIEEAHQIGYERVRLDTRRLSPAHSLYCSAGFHEILPCSESEIPHEPRSMSVYMERTLM